MGWMSPPMSFLLLVGVVLVNRRLLLIFLPCPLCVSSDSRKCFMTASAMRPGHNANCLFLIAVSHVGLVGIRQPRGGSRQAQVVF